MMKKSVMLILLVVMLALAGCSGTRPAGVMNVSGAWVRAVGGPGMTGGEAQPAHGGMGTPMAEGGMMAGMNSAAYMVIRNQTGTDDRLVRVESTVAGAVELHKTQVENEVMTMRPVDGIDLPAGGEAVLEPGGLHIMLIGVKQPLEAGQRVTLTLVFEKAPAVTVDAEVRAP